MSSRPIFLIVLFGLALRLSFALLPLEAHLILLEDDAWMVTAIARNFALGLGVTADGLNPTTGFQPLYPLTLGALPYLVAPQALDGGFTANLLICALLSTLALYPIWWLARHFGGDLAGLLAVALVALNPTIIRLTVNGMETALGLCLLLTLWMAFYRLDLTRMAHVALLAGLSALAILARLDVSLAFGVLTLALLSRRSWRAGLLYSGLTLLLLAPYFAWNVSITGSPMPSSGAALAFMQSYRGSFYLTNGVSALFQTSAVNLDWLPGLWPKLAFVLVVAGLGLWLIGRHLHSVLPILVFLALPPLYYGYLLQQIRERYFVGMSALLVILLAWMLAAFWQRRPQVGRVLVPLIVVVVIGVNTAEAVGFYERTRRMPELTQPISYQAALWIRGNLPADTLIGAKNSGIYQYYSGRTVLNIDGKLNHEIVPVMEQRMLLAYLREQGVQYLVDREETMARHVMFYSAEFGPAPYHRAPTLRERFEIYGRILVNTLGGRLPLHLDDPNDFLPTRPFTDAAEIVQTFSRPNQSTNPVVVYRLKPVGAPGVP